MKRKFAYIILTCIICFCLSSTAYGQESECQHDLSYGYRYFSLGVGPIVFIPNVGLGYRERYLQSGWDGSVSFSTIGYAHQMSGHFVGHHYLYPRQNSPYLGLGGLGSAIMTIEGWGGFTFSPDFVFGKELEKSSCYRHFIEMHLAMPTLWVDARQSEPIYFPLMYITYGLSF